MIARATIAVVALLLTPVVATGQTAAKPKVTPAPAPAPGPTRAPAPARPTVKAAPSASVTASAPAAALAEAADDLAAGSLERAAARATALVTRYRRDPRPRVLLARVQIEREDFDAAYQTLAEAVAISPRDVDVLYYLGFVSARLAGDRLDQVVTGAPTSARAHQLAAEALEAQDRRADAEAEYEKAVAAAPTLLDPLLGLGRLKRIRIECDGAVALYERAEAIRPTYEGAYGLGSCKLRQGEAAAARDAFRRALTHDRDAPLALVGLGSALLRLGQTADGIQQLQRAVTLAPAMDDGWYVLGRAYQESGDAERARQAFATVARLRGQDGSR